MQLRSKEESQCLKSLTVNKQEMAQLEIKQVKSRIGQCKRQKATLDALGLRKMNAVVVHDSNLTIKGMVEKVKHLVEVKEI